MAYEDRKEYNKQYFKDNWQQVKLSMPNDEAAALRQYCQDHGIPVAGFIRQLVKAAISEERSADTTTPGVLEDRAGVGVTPK